MAEWKELMLKDEKYTDAEVDAIVLTHKNITGAHHTKYTDAEAVSAVATADDYVKNDGDNMSDCLRILTPTAGVLTRFGMRYPTIELRSNAKSGYTFGDLRINDNANGNGHIDFFRQRATSPYTVQLNDALFQLLGWGHDGTHEIKSAEIQMSVDGTVTANCVPGRISLLTRAAGNTAVSPTENFVIKGNGDIDMKDNKIVDPKNLAASALSGTKKLVEIDIGGTSYYFEVYPTKA